MSSSPTNKSGRRWGTDTYRKWDNLSYESDEEERSEREPTRFDHGEECPGGVKLKRSDRIIVSPSTRVGEQVRKLTQAPKEVWQVIVRKLRVWSADSTALGLPCRPYCILIVDVYPAGRLLTKQVCNPPELPPNPEVIMKLLLDTMLEPSSGAQRRPAKILFPDFVLAGEVSKSLEVFSIEVSQLSEPDGIDDYVSAISNKMIKLDMANRGEASEESGLLATAGVCEVSVRGLYVAAAEVLRRAPWIDIAERQCLELELRSGEWFDSKPSWAKKVWIMLLGNASVCDGRVVPTPCDSEGGVFGIALHRSRLDCESRALPAGRHSEVWRPEPVCSYSGELAEDGKKLKRTKPRTYDIRSGNEICYKVAASQRAHWPEVKRYSKPLEEREKGMREGRMWWGDREASCLFKHPTLLPFDDHDAIDSANLPLADDCGTNAGGPLQYYPLPLVVRRSVAGRPCLEDITWLERALRSVLAAIDVVKAGGENERDLLSRPLSETEVEVVLHDGKRERVGVRFNPVLLESEVERAKQRAAATAAGGGEEKSTAGPSAADATAVDEAQPTEGGGDDDRPHVAATTNAADATVPSSQSTCTVS